MTIRVALLGLGHMGHAIGERLLSQGQALTVWTRSAEKCRDLGAKGADIAASPAEAAASADIVLLCLQDENVVEAVLFGGDGVAAGINHDAVILDTTTMSPGGARSLAARLKEETGADWIDCPVSGGPLRALDGKLIGFWGGDDATGERVAPIFASVFQRVTHMGPIGTGQMMKLCNQLIVSGLWQLLPEAFALGGAAGITGETMMAAMTGGLADGVLTQIMGQRIATNSYDPPSGTLATMLKDVRLIDAAVQAEGLDLPMQQATLATYQAGYDAGYGAREPGATVELRRRRRRV